MPPVKPPLGYVHRDTSPAIEPESFLTSEAPPPVRVGRPTDAIPIGTVTSGGVGEDVYAEGMTVAQSSIAVRLGFIRKVYGILSVQLLVSLAFILVCQYNSSVKNYVQTHPEMLWVAFFVTFGIVIFFACIPSLAQNYPGNMIGLAIFTLFEAYLLGTVTSFYNTSAVLQAVIITAVITVCLSLYALQTKRDLSQWGMYLFVALIVLLVGGLLRLAFPESAVVETIYAGLGALLFSLYIVYDTWLLANVLSPDDYVFGALKLYLDIINLFLFILQLLGRRN